MRAPLTIAVLLSVVVGCGGGDEETTNGGSGGSTAGAGGTAAGSAGSAGTGPSAGKGGSNTGGGGSSGSAGSSAGNGGSSGSGGSSAGGGGSTAGSGGSGGSAGSTAGSGGSSGSAGSTAGSGGSSGSGGSAGAGAGVFDLKGTNNGAPLIVTSVAAGHSGPTLVFSDADDECKLQASGVLQANKFRISGFVPEMSGTFQVPTDAQFYFSQLDAACKGTNGPAVTGTITLDSFTEASVSGTISLTWTGGALSGTFSRPICYQSPAAWNGMCQ